jgi:hypothetical protein
LGRYFVDEHVHFDNAGVFGGVHGLYTSGDGSFLENELY